MKKFILSLLVLLFLSAPLFAVTLVTKNETDPEVTLTGYQWIRYTLNYTADKLAINQLAIKRTYISTKIKGMDYEANLTLDMGNSLNGQAGYDWAIWEKLAYVDLTKLPFLSDMGIKIRTGIQPIYFGSGDYWTYPLIELPFEGKIGALSSADMGVAILGKYTLDSYENVSPTVKKKQDLFVYELALYSGDGYGKLDTDVSKALAGNLMVYVMPGLGVRGSYFKKAGITSFGVGSADKTVTAVMVKYNVAPFDIYAEVLEQKAPASVVGGVEKSGILQAVSVYCGYTVFDWLSAHLRYDTVNPDTRVINDDMNYFYSGLNFKVAQKVSLQINYQLEMKKVYQAGNKNNNLLMTQVKWEW